MNTNALVAPVTALGPPILATARAPLSTTTQTEITNLLDGARPGLTAASAPAAQAIYADEKRVSFALTAVVRGEDRAANAQAAVIAILLALANGASLETAVTGAIGGEAGAAIVRSMNDDLTTTEAAMDDLNADLATYAYEAVGPNMHVAATLPTDGATGAG